MCECWHWSAPSNSVVFEIGPAPLPGLHSTYCRDRRPGIGGGPPTPCPAVRGLPVFPLGG
ncbi:hypothetical protein ANMWB30_35120 [Arthrobacter sp. MWB30]|nr:hypothetical protein ANMWB30_35120 [Arthrobacter sp. MWB30]